MLNFLSQEVEDSVLPDMDFTKKPNLDYFTGDFGIFEKFLAKLHLVTLCGQGTKITETA